jgi:hypothetical protein
VPANNSRRIAPAIGSNNSPTRIRVFSVRCRPRNISQRGFSLKKSRTQFRCAISPIRKILHPAIHRRAGNYDVAIAFEQRTLAIERNVRRVFIEYRVDDDSI